MHLDLILIDGSLKTFQQVYLSSHKGYLTLVSGMKSVDQHLDKLFELHAAVKNNSIRVHHVLFAYTEELVWISRVHYDSQCSG